MRLAVYSPCAMRVRNEVLAAKCSDRWIGLRSPVSCAKPTTSDDDTVLLSRSAMPTDRSSKNSVRSGGRFMALFQARRAFRCKLVGASVGAPPEHPAYQEKDDGRDRGNDAVLDVDVSGAGFVAGHECRQRAGLGDEVNHRRNDAEDGQNVGDEPHSMFLRCRNQVFSMNGRHPLNAAAPAPPRAAASACRAARPCWTCISS